MKQSFSQCGQAMVEFALMLVIIMLLCVGMLHISNLLNYDYWAQQEARFLAFEQTWVPWTSYADSVHEPIETLEDHERFRRPGSVQRLDADKDIEQEDSLSDLLAYSDIWHRRTDNLWRNAKKRLELVHTAFASEDMRAIPEGLEDLWFDDYEIEAQGIRGPRSELEHGLSNLLEAVGFGEVFCSTMARQSRLQGSLKHSNDYSDSQCAKRYSGKFGVHLAQNVDFRSLFDNYGEGLESGVEAGEAFEMALQGVIANQYYSFFDAAVRDAQEGAEDWLSATRVALLFSDVFTDTDSMLMPRRYFDSDIAVTEMVLKIRELALDTDASNRDALAEKDFEDLITDVVFAEMEDESFYLAVGPMGGLPATFGPILGKLQEGVMENVLMGGIEVYWLSDEDADETHLIEPFVYAPNKESVVHYHSDKGIFPAARRRFKGSPVLSSRFYLVTQPWHITRRENGGLGSFREVGTQIDTMGQETEEGILRRRVSGLWMFPSAPGAMLDTISAIPGLEGLSPFFDQIKRFDDKIAKLKKFVFQDNPVDQLFDALSRIPYIGGLVPTFPEWPSVRPAAYPGSTEMRDEDNIPDDHMVDKDEGAGEPRNFEDYVEEQEYDPEP